MSGRKILLILLTVIALAALTVSCSRSSSVNMANSIYLYNCRMIDGTGTPLVEDAAILIEDGRITQSGTRDSFSVPENAKMIDLSNATVLPGIINAHVHGAYDGETLQSWLKAGVTAVRDEAPFIQDFLAKRDSLNQNSDNATIISATPILTVPGGYGLECFSSAREAQEVVERYIEDGIDIIKFSLEDNLQGRLWETPTYEEVKAIVDAAHAGNRKVSVHLTRQEYLQWAIDAGVDDISHMVVDPLSVDIARSLVEKDIYWVPTLELWQGVSSMHGLNWIDTALSNLKTFYEAGGKVALGTDFAGYVCSFDKGFPITEVTLMKQAGMSNMDIIVAGTKNAAYVCGLEGSKGTIAPGMDADLLIVNGNPLVDINALVDVRMVVHDGRIIVENEPTQS